MTLPGTTSRLALKYALGGDLVSSFPASDAANAATLDTLAVDKQGTHAARPAANTVAQGTYYYEADTKQLYRSDGAAWQPMVPANSLTAAQMTTAFAKDNVEPAFSTYKAASPWKGGPSASSGNGNQGVAGTFPLSDNAIVNAPQGSPNVFWFDPADYAAAGRSTKVRVRMFVVTNSVAPGVTVSGSLYSGSLQSGASGSASQWGLSSLIATASVSSPAANTAIGAVSSDVAAPSAGVFLFAATFSGTCSAGSVVDVRCQLQVRQV